jgi:hypothetical protein
VKLIRKLTNRAISYGSESTSWIIPSKLNRAGELHRTPLVPGLDEDTAPRCEFAKTAAWSCQLGQPFYLNVG